MGRLRAPTRLVLTPYVLEHLVRCAAETWQNMYGQRVILLRCDVVEELIRMARFGKGLATLTAKRPAERSASAQKAARAGWDRVRAQRNAVVVQERGAPTAEIKDLGWHGT